MFKKILIPVDVAVKDDTQKLLQAAKTLSADWSCERHVVTVTPNMGMAIVGSYFDENHLAEGRKAAAEQLEQAAADAGLEATQHVLSGTVYDRVIELATTLDADLIIIGAHQPDLRDYLLGSNAARVVRHSNRSVLVLRG